MDAESSSVDKSREANLTACQETPSSELLVENFFFEKSAFFAAVKGSETTTAAQRNPLDDLPPSELDSFFFTPRRGSRSTVVQHVLGQAL